jgi:hypothetical protein
MNIPDHDAADDLQELNCHLQALEPPDQGGARVGEVNPNAELGGDPPGDATLLAPPGGSQPPGGGNPCGMLWENLVEVLNLEPHELAYYLAKDHEDATLDIELS